jgi:hypothetical protein
MDDFLFRFTVYVGSAVLLVRVPACLVAFAAPKPAEFSNPRATQTYGIGVCVCSAWALSAGVEIITATGLMLSGGALSAVSLSGFCVSTKAHAETVCFRHRAPPPPPHTALRLHNVRARSLAVALHPAPQYMLLICISTGLVAAFSFSSVKKPNELALAAGLLGILAIPLTVRAALGRRCPPRALLTVLLARTQLVVVVAAFQWRNRIRFS